MAFVVPSFPIVCAMWRNFVSGVSVYASPTQKNIPCNLTPGKRVMLTFMIPVTNAPSWGDLYVFPYEVLFPPLQDIQVQDNTHVSDLLEIPWHSGRLYVVYYVDDIAKGFANEHRFAAVHRFATDCVFADTTITVPKPLT